MVVKEEAKNNHIQPISLYFSSYFYIIQKILKYSICLLNVNHSIYCNS